METQHDTMIRLDEVAQEMERKYDLSLPAMEPFVVRLDGVAFRNYTSSMQKPFDKNLTKAIILTARDLIQRFNPLTVYYQSDEISLIFGPSTSQGTVIYGGRIQKISSVIASVATASFNHHIRVLNEFKMSPPKQNNIEPVEHADKIQIDSDDRLDQKNSKSSPPKFFEAVVPGKKQKLNKNEPQFAYFDARAFSTKDMEGVEKVIYWRHAFDGRRNAVGMVGSHLFGHKEIKGLSLNQLLEKIRMERGIDPYRHYSAAAMYGVFLKRIEYPLKGFNPITGKTVLTNRTKIEARSLNWTKIDVKNRLNILFARMWEPDHPKSLEPIDI